FVRARRVKGFILEIDFDPFVESSFLKRSKTFLQADNLRMLAYRQRVAVFPHRVGGKVTQRAITGILEFERAAAVPAVYSVGIFLKCGFALLTEDTVHELESCLTFRTDSVFLLVLEIQNPSATTRTRTMTIRFSF